MRWFALLLLVGCGGSPYEGHWTGGWGSYYEAGGLRGRLESNGEVLDVTVDGEGKLEGAAEAFSFTGTVDDAGACKITCTQGTCWSWAKTGEAGTGKLGMFAGRLEGSFVIRPAQFGASLSLEPKK